ncbi:LAMI_0E07624g1_1 [Lachancea mirantina]|uniref:Protein transport protein sec16 n=1 Tax=Lachancea mirantina TaxID=1230905 RepID=A0A1G4JMW6_9SACH|nr:LAMI_0E07624g1_1 [Lachancea mirantina]
MGPEAKKKRNQKKKQKLKQKKAAAKTDTEGEAVASNQEQSLHKPESDTETGESAAQDLYGCSEPMEGIEGSGHAEESNEDQEMEICPHEESSIPVSESVTAQVAQANELILTHQKDETPEPEKEQEVGGNVLSATSEVEKVPVNLPEDGEYNEDNAAFLHEKFAKEPQPEPKIETTHIVTNVSPSFLGPIAASVADKVDTSHEDQKQDQNEDQREGQNEENEENEETDLHTEPINLRFNQKAGDSEILLKEDLQNKLLAQELADPAPVLTSDVDEEEDFQNDASDTEMDIDQSVSRSETGSHFETIGEASVGQMNSEKSDDHDKNIHETVPEGTEAVPTDKKEDLFSTDDSSSNEQHIEQNIREETNEPIGTIMQAASEGHKKSTESLSTHVSQEFISTIGVQNGPQTSDEVHNLFPDDSVAQEPLPWETSETEEKTHVDEKSQTPEKSHSEGFSGKSSTGVQDYGTPDQRQSEEISESYDAKAQDNIGNITVADQPFKNETGSTAEDTKEPPKESTFEKKFSFLDDDDDLLDDDDESENDNASDDSFLPSDREELSSNETTAQVNSEQRSSAGTQFSLHQKEVPDASQKIASFPVPYPAEHGVAPTVDSSRSVSSEPKAKYLPSVNSSGTATYETVPSFPAAGPAITFTAAQTTPHPLVKNDSNLNQKLDAEKKKSDAFDFPLEIIPPKPRKVSHAKTFAVAQSQSPVSTFAPARTSGSLVASGQPIAKRNNQEVTASRSDSVSSSGSGGMSAYGSGFAAQRPGPPLMAQVPKRSAFAPMVPSQTQVQNISAPSTMKKYAPSTLNAEPSKFSNALNISTKSARARAFSNVSNGSTGSAVSSYGRGSNTQGGLPGVNGNLPGLAPPTGNLAQNGESAFSPIQSNTIPPVLDVTSAPPHSSNFQKRSHARSNSSVYAPAHASKYAPTVLPQFQQPVSHQDAKSYSEGSYQFRRFSRSGSSFHPPMGPTALAQEAVQAPVDNEAMLKRQFPIFHWGKSSKVVFSFNASPPENGLYGAGDNGISVRVVGYDRILKSDIIFKAFPGPLLRNKSKEKDVVKWIDDYITEVSKREPFKDLTIYEILKVKILKGNLKVLAKALYDYEELLPFLSQPISSKNESSSATKLNETNQLRILAYLQMGGHEQALELALDHKDYALALMLGSLMGKEKWSSVVNAYLHEEFGLKHEEPHGFSVNLLTIIFQVFVGNAKRVMEDITSDPLLKEWALRDWKIIISAILNNINGAGVASESDNSNSSNPGMPAFVLEFIVSFGAFLAQNNDQLAGAVCFILCNLPLSPAEVFPGSDVRFQSIGNTNSIEAALLTEIYDFCQTTTSRVPELTCLLPQLLTHASALADYGLASSASKYTEAITANLKMMPKGSALAIDIAARLEFLNSKLVGSNGSWLAKPKLSTVWGQIDKSFNKFIGGDDDEVLNKGPKDKIFESFTPTTSRNASMLDLHSDGILNRPQAPFIGNSFTSQNSPNGAHERATLYGSNSPAFNVYGQVQSSVERSAEVRNSRTLGKTEAKMVAQEAHSSPQMKVADAVARPMGLTLSGRRSVTSLNSPVRLGGLAPGAAGQPAKNPVMTTPPIVSNRNKNKYSPAQLERRPSDANAPFLANTVTRSLTDVNSEDSGMGAVQYGALGAFTKRNLSRDSLISRRGSTRSVVSEEALNQTRPVSIPATSNEGSEEELGVESAITESGNASPLSSCVRLNNLPESSTLNNGVYGSSSDACVESSPRGYSMKSSDQLIGVRGTSPSISATDSVKVGSLELRESPTNHHEPNFTGEEPDPVLSKETLKESSQELLVNTAEPIWDKKAASFHSSIRGSHESTDAFSDRDQRPLGLDLPQSPPVRGANPYAPVSSQLPKPTTVNNPYAPKDPYAPKNTEDVSSPKPEQGSVQDQVTVDMPGNSDYNQDGNQTIPTEMSHVEEDSPKFLSPVFVGSGHNSERACGAPESKASSVAASDVEEQGIDHSYKREKSPKVAPVPIIRPAGNMSFKPFMPALKPGQETYYDDVVEDESEDEDDASETARETADAEREQKKREEEAERKRLEAKKGEKKEKEKKDLENRGQGGAGSWFGWLKKDSNEKKPVKAKLGHQNTFYYDEKLKRWVNKNATEKEKEELATPTPPPPPVIKRKPANVPESKPRSGSMANGAAARSSLVGGTHELITTPDLLPHSGQASPPVTLREKYADVNLTGKKANGLDDIMSLVSGPNVGGASSRKKKKATRGYVNVMNNM